ncbi:DUF4362 domain-containing protein [Bacillus infantis]|uniref:DUF4362 domain-containing protein n=1 Tax=Bacillus infantis TaxID=324767 RepID=UPI003CF451E4
MKKLFPLYILVSLILLSCQTQEEPAPKLPDYKPSEDDIVSMHGDINNLDKFFSFITNIQMGSEDTIRVVSYTEEGAPILHDLEYDGQVILSILDTRRDGFGAGMVEERKCKSVNIEKGKKQSNYTLTGCGWKKEDYSILIISK